MPFMRGAAPVRRTLKYLDNYKMKLKNNVEVITLHYNMKGDHHQGAREFAFWQLPQLQYQNQNVQIISLRNMTPSPFIRIFLKDEEDILVDIDGKGGAEIASHLKKIICQSDSKLEADAKQASVNPAHFGWGCNRQCMCEIVGQVPCPGIVPLPRTMRGKYIHNAELLEEFEDQDDDDQQEEVN